MAGTVTLYSDKMFGEAREVIISCVGDSSDGTLPDTDICDLSGYVYGPIVGWGFWLVETYPGTTGPTDNSDLYLKTEYGNDLLSGAGENSIDNAATNIIWPPITVIPIGETLTIDVDNQAVHSGAFKIKFHLIRG